ncbi:hypothetical protein [Nocardia sp. NPDC058666]
MRVHDDDCPDPQGSMPNRLSTMPFFDGPEDLSERMDDDLFDAQ